MKKKIGYKALVEEFSGSLFSSAIMCGWANAIYKPGKITRGIRFKDGTNFSREYIRLPLLVFKTFNTAEKFVRQHGLHLKIWKVCYIPGKPFLPCSDVRYLTCGVYYNQQGSGDSFPDGTDFASCLKLIAPIKDNSERKEKQ